MSQSRTIASLKNVSVIWLGQLVSVLCTFITRMVFVRYLSQDYLGLETLFSNVLSILALAELGIGSAIVFTLYKPLAEDDHEAIKSIMRLFGRCYNVIGVVIAILGCIIAPNITLFISDTPDIPHLSLYFLFFVGNTSVSYFFSYKGSLISADQKNYIVALIRYAFQIGLSLAQIAVLVLTGSYLLYLTCMLLSTLFMNITTAVTANRLYPYLKEKDIKPIDPEVLGTIKRNVAGMVIHKSSSVVNAPVNGVILSWLTTLSTVAIYGNYLLVMNSLARVVDQMFDAIVASIGNMGVEASPERQYEVYRTSVFVDSMLFGALVACYAALIAPFVEFAFGGNYLFPMHVALLFAAWFYFRGIRDASLSFISAYGLYWQTKYKALAETIVLLATTIPMTYFFGIEGLLVANIFVQVFISLLWEGLILHKHGFKRSAAGYFARQGLYTLVGVVLTVVACVVVSFIPGGPILRFLVGAVACLVIGFGGYALVFWRTREMREVLGIVKSLAARLKSRRKGGAA